MSDIEEVRIVTAVGTSHRGFMDSHGVLFTNEGCNLEAGEAAVGREIVRRTEGQFRYSPEASAQRACEWCLR